MIRIQLNAVPESVRVDLCALAIMQTTAALASPEGREAVEKGKKEYLRHLAEKGRSVEQKQNSLKKEPPTVKGAPRTARDISGG